MKSYLLDLNKEIILNCKRVSFFRISHLIVRTS